MKKKPDRNWNLYRAQLSCKIGRDALDGKINTHAGVYKTEWALYNLLQAVEEIALHLDGMTLTPKKRKGE